MAPRKIKNIIQQYKSALIKAGFPRVCVLIFGSYARGDQRTDSDIDICLVSDLFKHDIEKYRKEAVYIAFQIDPRIQVVLANPKDLKENSLSPLFSSIYKDAIAA